MKLIMHTHRISIDGALLAGVLGVGDRALRECGLVPLA